MASRPKKSNADPYPPGWEPFLAAIKANMDEDTHRLVFADWLDENGDPERAEFIRIQCNLVPTLHGVARRERNKREHELLNANWDRWVSGFPTWLQQKRFSCDFTRGFLSSVSMTGPIFRKDGATITHSTPIQELSLYRVTGDCLRSPLLSQVGGLHLATIDSGWIRALASNPDLSALRSLAFRVKPRRLRYAPVDVRRADSLSQLFANPTLTRLRQFQLHGTGEGNAIASSLAAGQFQALEQLEIPFSLLTADGLKAIVNSPSARSLRGLYIAGNPIGDEGIRHLVEAPELRSLESLSLQECELTAESVRRLIDWPGLRTVKWLQLGGNGIGEPEASLIKRSPHAASLKVITAKL